MFASARVPDLDLYEESWAKREAIAARWDSGAITATEARAEIASARSAGISEQQRRQNGRAAATAAILSTMPVTCTTFGTVTTCN